MQEMTIEELIGEIRKGARVALMVRHAERPKMDPDDPTFGDALELTYEGTRTAEKLGVMLKEFADDVQFYASPLTRTRMTAELIAAGMGIPDANARSGPRRSSSESRRSGAFFLQSAETVPSAMRSRTSSRSPQ